MKYHKYQKRERKKAKKPLKRCIACGCSNLIESGKRFCAQHDQLDSSSDRSEYHRQNGWFYSSARWRKFRTWFLRRHPVCVECRAPAAQVDHIIPIAAGGATLSESNCQSFCASCHSKKTSNEQRRSNPAGEGGVKTCRAPRLLPHVQIKKSVRKFWAREVSDSANFCARVSIEGQKVQKMTDVTGGFANQGGKGEKAL